MKRLPVPVEMVGFWRCFGCHEIHWGIRYYEQNSHEDYCQKCFGQVQFRSFREQWKQNRKKKKPGTWR